MRVLTQRRYRRCVYVRDAGRRLPVVGRASDINTHALVHSLQQLAAIVAVSTAPPGALARVERRYTEVGVRRNQRLELPSVGVAAAAGSSSSRATVDGVKAWIATNRNQRTQRSYASGWRGFSRYLIERGTTAGDSTFAVEDIADYLRIRVEEQGVSASTVKGDRAAMLAQANQLPNLVLSLLK